MKVQFSMSINSNIKHERYIQFLERYVREHTPVAGAKIGSCLVHKGKIIAWSLNEMKSHPFQLAHGKNPGCIFLHAEINTIYRSIRYMHPDDYPKSTIYVTRLFKNHNRAMAKPCKGCAGAIHKFNIGTVVYTDLDGSTTVLQRKLDHDGEYVYLPEPA